MIDVETYITNLREIAKVSWDVTTLNCIRDLVEQHNRYVVAIDAHFPEYVREEALKSAKKILETSVALVLAIYTDNLEFLDRFKI